MWKTILLVLMLFVSVITSAHAEENDRWIMVGKDEMYTGYIDKNTIMSQNGDSEIIFWEKIIGRDGWQFWKKVLLNRKNKSCKTLYVKSIDYKGIVKEGISEDKGVYVFPDTLTEKLCNSACSLLHLPPVLGKDTHHWEKFYVREKPNWAYTDPEHYNRLDPTYFVATYYICTDSYLFNPSRRIHTFFVKENVYKTEYFLQTYRIDVKNQIIYYRGKKKVIVPESFEEALYNTVKKLI